MGMHPSQPWPALLATTSVGEDRNCRAGHYLESESTGSIRQAGPESMIKRMVYGMHVLL